MHTRQVQGYKLKVLELDGSQALGIKGVEWHWQG